MFGCPWKKEFYIWLELTCEALWVFVKVHFSMYASAKEDILNKIWWRVQEVHLDLQYQEVGFRAGIWIIMVRLVRFLKRLFALLRGLHTHVYLQWGGSRRKEGGTDVSIFFLCSGERKKRGLPLAAKLHQHLGIGDRPLMMPDRPWSEEECSEGVTLNGFDSSRHYQLHCSRIKKNSPKVCWLTKSMLVHPQEHVAKLSQESDPSIVLPSVLWRGSWCPLLA